ncbi:MAG: hypothetical protein ACE37K_11195 [Planctomycetota bacterium]
MSIPATGLPPPSAVAERPDPGFETSDSGPLVFGQTVDAELCARELLLTWSDKRREVADAIWRHYLEHGVGAFDWTPPGESQAIKVRWLTPPQFSYSSPTTASVSGELEVLLAHS